MTKDKERRVGSPSGLTRAVPRIKEELEVILELAVGDQSAIRCMRSNCMLTAFYRFGNTSSAGFGSNVNQPHRINSRFGLWGRDEEDKSPKY